MKTAAPVQHPDRFYIGGEWAAPSSDATIDVIDSGTEELFFQVAEAQADDVSRAVAAARTAFDEGPWTTMTHAERAEYLRAFGPALQKWADSLAQIWPREDRKSTRLNSSHMSISYAVFCLKKKKKKKDHHRDHSAESIR